MKIKLKLFFGIIIINLILCGCVRLFETSRIIAGTSVNALYAAREKGKSQIFNYDYRTCYDKTFSILKEMKAYIYLHSFKEKRIVAMNFKGPTNTTQVGIFFSKITPSTTKVEISCLSPSVLEYASTNIFAGLRGEKLKIDEPVLPVIK